MPRSACARLALAATTAMVALAVSACGTPSAPAFDSAPLLRLEAQAGSGWGASELSLDARRSAAGWDCTLRAPGPQAARSVLVHIYFDPALQALDVRRLCPGGRVALVAQRPGVLGFGVVMGEEPSLAPGALLTFTLRAAGGRAALAAPSGPRGRVDDLAASPGTGGGLQLDWAYKSTGDYDQNREVSISDLSPLGARMGASTSDGDLDEYDSVIDGDGNGEVNLADLTPIGAGFMATVSGYHIYRADGPDPETAGATLIGDAAFDASTLLPQSRRRFSFMVDSAALLPGSYYFVRAYDSGDSSEGEPSNVVGGNLDLDPPVWTSSVGVTQLEPDSGQITVHWGEATDAQSPPVQYVAYYNEGGSMNFATAESAVFDAPALSGVLSGLADGQEYSVVVRARDSATPPNEDTNLVLLGAVAGQVLPFNHAPSGEYIVDAGLGNSPWLELMPEIPDVSDAGAPVMAYIATDAGLTFQKLTVAHYQGGSWVTKPIQENRNFAFPALFWTGSEFALIAYDAADAKVVDIRLDSDLNITGQQDVQALPGETLTQLDADMSAGGAIGVAGGWSNGSVYFSETIGGNYNTSADLHGTDTIAGITCGYEPGTENAWLYFSHGTITTGETLLLDFDLSGGPRSGSWDIAPVGTAPNSPTQLDLCFDGAGNPRLALVIAQDFMVPIPGNPFTATLLYHAYTADFDGADWSFVKQYNSTFSFQIQFPPTTLPITIKAVPEVRWSRPDAIEHTIYSGTVELDLATMLPTAGSLAVSMSYLTDGGGGGFVPLPGYFTGTQGTGFSWQLSGTTHGAAYVRSPEAIDGSQILSGEFAEANALVYWQAPEA